MRVEKKEFDFATLKSLREKFLFAFYFMIFFLIQKAKKPQKILSQNRFEKKF
jgi:hypothetical protein